MEFPLYFENLKWSQRLVVKSVVHTKRTVKKGCPLVFPGLIGYKVVLFLTCIQGRKPVSNGSVYKVTRYFSLSCSASWEVRDPSAVDPCHGTVDAWHRFCYRCHEAQTETNHIVLQADTGCDVQQLNEVLKLLGRTPGNRREIYSMFSRGKTVTINFFAFKWLDRPVTENLFFILPIGWFHSRKKIQKPWKDFASHFISMTAECSSSILLVLPDWKENKSEIFYPGTVTAQNVVFLFNIRAFNRRRYLCA